jgi:hypothetical protein
MNVQARIDLEKRIVRKIVQNAIAIGYTVSLNDGEAWTVKRSVKVTEVMEAVQTTDWDFLKFRYAEGEKKGEPVGTVHLVYGNDGYDVIADYTDNAEIEKILETAKAYTAKYFGA